MGSRPSVAGGPAGHHGLGGPDDAGVFLARLTRLDAAAVVRLRSADSGRTELWARLPWPVLVQRTVAGPGPGDVTVSAAELLARLAAGDPCLPASRDGSWRWPLPSGAARTVESVPADELRRIAAAAAGTLRAATTGGVAGRAVGQRALRDALLDHVAIVVTADEAPARRIEVRQALVQAVVRMGFLGSAQGPVRVRTVGNWVGLDAPFGVAWIQRVNNLTLSPMINHPKG